MRFYRLYTAGILAALGLTLGAWSDVLPEFSADDPSVPGCLIDTADPNPPAYYRIDLITTRKVTGARLASGSADVLFVPSPFGVSISPSGTYVYDLDIHVDKIKPPNEGEYAVWITTPDLKNVHFLGSLDENYRVQGRVEWNKYLVVVSLETDIGDRWSGPIVLRGMSRSGLMHTMAGHGPFETENCAVFGYS